MVNTGWTLVMMMQSSDFNTLRYDSAYWSNDATLAETTLDPKVDVNMKNLAYSYLPVNKMRFDIVSVNNSRIMNVVGSSAKALLSGAFISGPFSRGDYISWLSDVSSTNFDGQPNCNAQGIQVSVSGSGQYCNCRFGISMNNENDCASNDAAVGIGCHTNSFYVNRFSAAGGHRWNPSERYSRRGWIYVK